VFNLGSRDENWRTERGHSSILHPHLPLYVKLRGHPQVPTNSFLEKEPSLLHPLDREVVDSRIDLKAVEK
jgi:hypothetical protein